MVPAPQENYHVRSRFELIELSADTSYCKRHSLHNFIITKARIMPNATLNLTIVPKRMLTKREASEHCGRPIRSFEIECPVAPVKFANGDLRWDVHDLDSWLDTLKPDNDETDAIVKRLG